MGALLRINSCALFVGRWRKWNNNKDWITEELAHLSVQAFCHWTYEFTNGQELMCDAQGSRVAGKYVFSDPCILSLDQRYGCTDFGQPNMEAWFSSHRCNEFCQDSWRLPQDAQRKYISSSRAETVSGKTRAVGR